MKKSTDKKKLIKIILQSLSISLAAIAVVMYGLSYIPASTDDMAMSIAAIRQQKHYEIRHNGKPVAWFGSIGDSIEPLDLALPKDPSAVSTEYISGCWINRYAFVPSCRGRILAPNTLSESAAELAKANGKAKDFIQKGISSLTKHYKQLRRKADELKYYLSVHNVSDNGYNTMAAYSASINNQTEEAERLLSALKTLTGNGKTTIVINTSYTLLYKGEGGKTMSIACSDITPKGCNPFIILQTAGGFMPDSAKAVCPHYRTIPLPKEGEAILSAAYPGMSQAGFSLNNHTATLFQGKALQKRRHNIPSMFAPDGAPVFSSRGYLLA